MGNRFHFQEIKMEKISETFSSLFMKTNFGTEESWTEVTKKKKDDYPQITWQVKADVQNAKRKALNHYQTRI